jgi:hypothetical protein
VVLTSRDRRDTKEIRERGKGSGKGRMFSPCVAVKVVE